MGMDLDGASGNYFRANCWSWRPIHALCTELNEEQNLGLNLDYWGSNDGAGLHSQADCDKLADAIEAHVKAGRKEYVLETGWGYRVQPDGTLGEGPGKSPYSTDAEHVLEFVKFLRDCGGSFAIY